MLFLEIGKSFKRNVGKCIALVDFLPKCGLFIRRIFSNVECWRCAKRTRSSRRELRPMLRDTRVLLSQVADTFCGLLRFAFEISAFNQQHTTRRRKIKSFSFFPLSSGVSLTRMQVGVASPLFGFHRIQNASVILSYIEQAYWKASVSYGGKFDDRFPIKISFVSCTFRLDYAYAYVGTIRYVEGVVFLRTSVSALFVK